VFATGLNDFGQLGIGSSVTHTLVTFPAHHTSYLHPHVVVYMKVESISIEKKSFTVPYTTLGGE
jgi:hypothetical protein